MRKIGRWCTWDGTGLDSCSFIDTDDSLTIEGVVISSPSEEYAAYYYVRADGVFCTREVRAAGAPSARPIWRPGCKADHPLNVLPPPVHWQPGSSSTPAH